MILESLEEVVAEGDEKAPKAEEPQVEDPDALEYWDMALDVLGDQGLLPKKPKYPEDPISMMPGEKTFTFKQYDDEA